MAEALAAWFSGSTSTAGQYQTTSSLLIVSLFMMSFDDFSTSKTAIFVIHEYIGTYGRTDGWTDGHDLIESCVVA